jgi:hypothetical protein
MLECDLHQEQQEGLERRLMDQVNIPKGSLRSESFSVLKFVRSVLEKYSLFQVTTCRIGPFDENRFILKEIQSDNIQFLIDSIQKADRAGNRQIAIPHQV